MSNSDNSMQTTKTTPAKRTKPTFSMTINSENYKQMIANSLQDPDRQRSFVASITSVVANNPALQECKSSTILAGALLGESLKLSPSPQLGQYYLIPFNCKEKRDRQGNIIEPKSVKAQFVLGYKGYMQLAQRSGQLKKLNVLAIKEGELIKFDALNEDIEVRLIDDWDEREQAKTIGYYAFFELKNGFRKAMYWSKKQMMSHADKFSTAFSKLAMEKLEKGEIPANEMWKYSSFWYKNFDDMACKTMLRQLISKGGCPMSVDMQSAYENDNKTVDFDENNEIVSQYDDIDITSSASVVSEDGSTTDVNQLLTPEATDVENKVDLATL